jgi:hypothetical protein
MNMLKYLLPLCLLATPCVAQQQQIVSPSATALQINSIIGQWAQTLEQQGKVIADLQAQLTAANAKIKELESKPDAKKE